MFGSFVARRRASALAAICLAIATSPSLAHADLHYQGGPPGALYWTNPAYWFENTIAGYNDNAIFNSIPYDNNWIWTYGGVSARNLTMLRGNWKFGGGNMTVANDLVVGDFAHPEQVSGYHNAYLTFDWDGSHLGLPQYQYNGNLQVSGSTIVGKSAGSDGYLTLTGCGTPPTLYTTNLYAGLNGNGTVNLQNASIRYVNLVLGSGAGTNGTLVADGAPVPTYNNCLQPDFVGINNAIPQVVIGSAGNGSMTFKHGANTVGIVDGTFGRLISSMGEVTLGALAGSNGTFDLQTGSSASAYALNVGVGGSGTLTMDHSTMLVARPYSNRFIAGAGMVRVQGQSGAASLVRLNHQSNLTTDAGVSMGTDTTLEVLGASKLKTTFFSVDGGVTTINGFNSNLFANSSYVGQPDSPNFSSLTVENDATATFTNLLKTGDNGIVSVFTGGTITVGFPSFGTQPGHIQVGPSGILGGRGIFKADVDVNGGIIDPGFSPGLMTVNGNFSMTSGDFYIELDGLTPGTGYDVLSVTGNLSITGGTINFYSPNGWVPPIGSTFDFFHAGNLFIGSGVTISSNVGSNFIFNPGTGSGTIAAVPEPASFAILAIGGLGLLRRRKR